MDAHDESSSVHRVATYSIAIILALLLHYFSGLSI
jgi:hypothetical protein